MFGAALVPFGDIIMMPCYNYQQNSKLPEDMDDRSDQIRSTHEPREKLVNRGTYHKQDE